MCNPAEHYHIIVPPRFEDIEDEEYRAPFPPPISPVSVQFPRRRTGTSSSSAHSLPSEEDEKVGGLLLSQMEERPMTTRTNQNIALDMDKLLSKNGISALCNIFENVSFKGQGHEAEDLRTLLDSFQCWGRQIFPQHAFEDLVTQLEEIGDTTEIQTCLRGIQPDFVSTCGQTECVGCEDPGVTTGVHCPAENTPSAKKTRDEGLRDRLAMRPLNCDIAEKWQRTVGCLSTSN